MKEEVKEVTPQVEAFNPEELQKRLLMAKRKAEEVGARCIKPF